MSFKFEKLIVWQNLVTNAEFKSFFSIALRSDIEVVGCIYSAKRRNIISDDDFNKVYT